MAAYVVFIREAIKDAGEMAKYGALARAILPDHPIKLLARYEPHEVWEGDQCEAILIMQFPDGKAAKRWYNSPEYQLAREHRLLGADYRVIFTESADRE